MYSTYPPPHAGDVLVPLPPQQKNVHPSRRHPAALRDNLVAAHRNDVANASAADHHCATKISATWRGYITRKRLATRHITRSYQYLKAVKIQCFVRCAFARRAAGYLREQREEICRARNDALIAQRVNELKGAVKWQAALFEASALKIQTIFRWKYAKRRKSIVVTNTGELKIIEEDVTPVLPKRQYMPQYWRRRSTVVLRSAQQKALEITENPSPRNRGPLNGSTEENTPIEKMMLSPAPPRSVPPQQQQQQREFASAGDRALPCLVGSPASLPTGAMSTQQLVLYDNPQATGREVAILSPQPPAHKRFGGPPTQATVEAINERNRRRDQELSELIESEQQQLRIRDRIDGIVQADLDHCAAVLQRRFRVAAAKQNLHSRQCLSEYLNRYAIIIQCAFRSFISRLHASQHRRDISTDIYMASQKYGMTQVERLKQEFVWNASIMTKAARTIQTGFRRFRYLSQYDADSGVAYEDYIRKGPPALPLGLMKDVPEHRTSTQSTSHSDDVAVQKYVFRRHKGPAARKALAEEKARAAAAATQVASAASNNDETDAPTTPAAEEQSSSYAPVTSPPMAVLPDDAEARYPDVLDDEQPVSQEPVDPQTEAATRIQSCFRQHSARANVAARKEQRDAAFEKLLAEEAAKNLINNSQRRASGETGDTPEEVPVTGAAPPSAALAADSSTTPANSSDAVVDAYAVPDSDHAAAQPDSNDADTTAPTNAPAEPHDDVVVASEVAADLPPTKDDVAPVAEHSPQAETDQ
ncbi:IQ calmodulin-binding protein, putative [Bodo saltans]|uniref:IQ calmodulin-binding protein, putative n=1 Tax=Bodo saltans TaxID=75058 RepID=A0A0S4ITG4_BODSA|nr:IQ calmodulin-binding protein, putative [Bodo saltans]|eukprot:CUF73902.1 IQ calmodulin-binding protein, putative [Bodo saltans]